MKRDIDHSADQMEGLLDRLACGELAEADRKPLFAWLEEDPRRWRTCALALLEAQCWSQALSSEEDALSSTPASDHVVPRTAVVTGGRPSTCRRGPKVGWLLAISVCAVAAFGLGLMAHRPLFPPRGSIGVDSRGASPNTAQPSDESPPPAAEEAAPMLASIALRSSPGGLTEVQIPVVSGDDAASPRAETVIADHIRRQWESRGYRIQKDQRYLIARLRDGRQVVVPVDGVQVEYVGSQVN